MKARPPCGLVGEMNIVVGPEYGIEMPPEGMPAVFSTPKMIGLMERTARESMQSFLEIDERTVGVEVDIKHLAPAPMGARVTITTRVVGVEGSFVQFSVEARDDRELLAKGLHKRAVIRLDQFAKRLSAKLG